MSSLTGARGTYRVDPDLRREGGQAEVLRATGPDGAAVAIKLPRAGRSHGWFTREAALLRQLSQQDRPWVVPLVDEGIGPDGRPFIVLPWFDEALDEWLERRPAIERIFEALTQACESVVRLHRAPVDLANVLVHRDVKPYNFLVRDDGAELTVVLADLGIAKEGRLAETAAQTGVFTEYYAPPEQQLPLALPPDPAMDVHGMAATVWFGICDRVPRSLFSRQAAWKDEAADLRALAMLGTRRTEADEARFEELRRLPIEAYADLEMMAALRPQDEQEFVQRLEAAFGPRVAEPNVLARTVAERLLPVLRRCLEPDHRRRIGEAQRLYAAVRQARDAVFAAVGGARVVESPKPPVVVGPGGGTLVPSGPVETFNPGEGDEVTAERSAGLETGRLPSIQPDGTGERAVAVARPAPMPPPEPMRERAVARTHDPSRTMDPFSDPVPPAHRGWIAAAGVAGLGGLFVLAAVVGVAWYAWPGGDEGTVTAEPVAALGAAEGEGEPTAGAAPPPVDGASTPSADVPPAVPARPEEPPVAVAAPANSKDAEARRAEEKRLANEAASKAKEVAATEEKRLAEENRLAEEKRVAEEGPLQAAAEAVRPVTLTVLRCAGQVEAGELKLDGVTAASSTVTLSPGKHTIAVLSVTAAGATERWPVVSVMVEAEGLRLRDRLVAVGDSRSTSIRLDDAGRVVASRSECR